MKKKIEELIKKYEDGVERLNEVSHNLMTEPRDLTHKEWESLTIAVSMAEATNKVIKDLKQILENESGI